ncbi:hypothetical protein [Paenibacillus xylanilyticus]|uniref:hypothetical protein n=1 Tax=Paenibacillus xylanilyticus TaxID=248903 RepID=UPI0039A051D1
MLKTLSLLNVQEMRWVKNLDPFGGEELAMETFGRSCLWLIIGFKYPEIKRMKIRSLIKMCLERQKEELGSSFSRI